MLLCIRARSLLSNDSGQSTNPDDIIKTLMDTKSELTLKLQDFPLDPDGTYGIKDCLNEAYDLIDFLQSRIQSWISAEKIANHNYNLRKQVLFIEFLENTV